MESISELLERIFSLLILIVPIYLYMLVRKIIFGRKRRQPTAGKPPKRKDGVLSRLLRREQRHLGPLIPQEEPLPQESEPSPSMTDTTFDTSAKPPQEATEKPVHRLDRFLDYPPGMRAVILHEILERHEYRDL